MILDGLEPREVFARFEEIAGIPHGSGNTKGISDFCVEFARERGLECFQDDAGNVIIWKDGSAGYEGSAPVMLQGHLDMVCEKDAWVDIDFEKDGLRLVLEGDTITADGTTLGGDDGIAIAYCLAILDSDEVVHPPLECVFTVDEEIGMLGAAVLDMGRLRSKRLINIDSEDEGHLLVSCAGGVTSVVHIPVSRERAPEGYEFVSLEIENLTGGHSGVEIDKGRANADKLLGRLLYEVSTRTDARVLSVSGGTKDNAIPKSAQAVLAVKDRKIFDETSEKYALILNNEYRYTDPDLAVISSDADETEKEETALDMDSTRRVIAALVSLPNGIQRMCHEPEGLVQTSLNLGILQMSGDEVSA